MKTTTDADAERVIQYVERVIRDFERVELWELAEDEFLQHWTNLLSLLSGSFDFTPDQRKRVRACARGVIRRMKAENRVLAERQHQLDRQLSRRRA